MLVVRLLEPDSGNWSILIFFNFNFILFFHIYFATGVLFYSLQYTMIK